VHYRLQGGDILDIAVSGYPELSGSAKVREDGGIVLPGSGLIVRAAGRTAEAFAALAASAIQGKVLKTRPEVSVEVRKGPEYFIFVTTPEGKLKTVPAADASTLAALVTYLDRTNLLPEGLGKDQKLKVSYPLGGGTFSVTVPQLIAGEGRGLPLTPGSVVEIIEQSQPVETGEREDGNQVSSQADKSAGAGLARWEREDDWW
jgi:hypothetical protein